MRGEREGGEEANGPRRVGGESGAYESGRRTAKRGETRGGRRMGGTRAEYIGDGLRRDQPGTSGMAGASEVWRQCFASLAARHVSLGFTDAEGPVACKAAVFAPQKARFSVRMMTSASSATCGPMRHELTGITNSKHPIDSSTLLSLSSSQSQMVSCGDLWSPAVRLSVSQRCSAGQNGRTGGVLRRPVRAPWPRSSHRTGGSHCGLYGRLHRRRRYRASIHDDGRPAAQSAVVISPSPPFRPQ